MRAVELTPELEESVAAKIASGRYKDASEMVREALQFKKEDDAKLEALELSLEEGEASGICEDDAFQAVLDAMESDAIGYPERVAS